MTENEVISIMQWGIIDDFSYYYDDRVIYGYALGGILRLAGRRVYVALFIMVISDNKNSTVYLFVAVCVAYCSEQVLFVSKSFINYINFVKNLLKFIHFFDRLYM